MLAVSDEEKGPEDGKEGDEGSSIVHPPAPLKSTVMNVTAYIFVYL